MIKCIEYRIYLYNQIMAAIANDDYIDTSFVVDEGNSTIDMVEDNNIDDNTYNYYYTQDQDTSSSSNFIILHHLNVKIVTSVILAVYLIGFALLVIINYAVNKEIQRTRQKMAKSKRKVENKSSFISITKNNNNIQDSRSLLEKILQFSSSSITLFLCWCTIYLIFFPVLIPCTIVLFVVRVGVFSIVKVLLRKKLHWGSGNDTIWGSEETAQTSIMTALYILENEPDLEKIRKIFTENVLNRKEVTLFDDQNGHGKKVKVNYEKFKWSLKNYGGFFYWEEFDNFSIEDHIKSMPQSIQDEVDVFDQLSQLSHEPFESKYPPWEILLSSFKYEDDGDNNDSNSSSNFNTPQVNFNRKYVRNKAGSSKPNNAHYSSGKFSISKVKSSPSPSTKSHKTTTTSTTSNSINQKSHYALILRFHHSLLDGISAGLIFNYLVADKPATLSVNPLKFNTTNRNTTNENNNNNKCIQTTLKLVYYYSAALFLSPLILLENFTRSNKIHYLHKKTRVTGPKFFTWLKPISLEDLKEIKKLTGANVTSIFMAALGNTVSDILSHHHKIPKTSEMSVKMESESLNKVTMIRKKSVGFSDMPNSITIAQTAALLPYRDINPSNRFSIVMTPVQLKKIHNVSRTLIDNENEDGTEIEILNHVQRVSTSTFGIASVLVNFYSMKFMGYLPLILIKFLSQRVDASLTCSNIPGPVSQVSAFHGDVVKDLVFWAPMKNRTAIGANFFSYAGNVRIGIVADYTVFQDIHQVNNFAKTLHEQVYKLLRVARDMSKLKDDV